MKDNIVDMTMRNNCILIFSEHEDFTDCRENFEQTCNKLEREYFETLHVENVESNEVYVDSPVPWY